MRSRGAPDEFYPWLDVTTWAFDPGLLGGSGQGILRGL